MPTKLVRPELAPRETVSGVPRYPDAFPAEEADFRHYLNLIWRGRALACAVFVLGLAIGGLVAATSRPIYRAESYLLVQVPPPARAPQLADPSNPLGALLAASQPPSIAAQLVEMESEGFQDEAEQRAGVHRKPGSRYPLVRTDSPVDSDVIKVMAEDPSPEEAARLANGVAALHLERIEQWQVAGLDRALRYVVQERDEAARKLERVRLQLDSFARAHALTRRRIEQETQVKQYADLRAKAHEARSSANAVRVQLEQLKAQLKREPVDLAQRRTQVNPLRLQLEEKLRQLTLLRLDQLEDFEPTSDPVQRLDEQIARVRGQLRRAPPSATVQTFVPNPRRELIEGKVAELQTALVQHEANYLATTTQLQAQQRGVDPDSQQVQLDNLNYEREQAQARYTLLANRLQDLEVRKNARPPIARIIDEASVPTRPISPGKLVIMLVAACTSLLAALGTALLRGLLDDRLHSPQQAESLSALPTLGSLPPIPSAETALLTANPSNPHLMDAYRVLRSSMALGTPDTLIRRLQITSARSGDGTSITAANLAIAVAMTGKSVILVEADMRAPSLHKHFELAAEPGLLDILQGAADLEAALQDSGVKNLRVLCGGAKPHDAAELLESPIFDAVVSQLSGMADVVIFDTPACLDAADALIVAPRMDGVLLMVHAAQTRKADATRALALLERVGAPLMGTLFIGARSAGGRSYGPYPNRSIDEAIRQFWGGATGKGRTPDEEPGGSPNGYADGHGTGHGNQHEAARHETEEDDLTFRRG